MINRLFLEIFKYKFQNNYLKLLKFDHTISVNLSIYCGKLSVEIYVMNSN